MSDFNAFIGISVGKLARLLAVAVAGVCIPAIAQAQAKQVLSVPGFANFAEIDGATAWINNEERVEHWSAQGKLGEVVMSTPCGAMVVLHPILWVADCKNGSLNQIDMRSMKVIASVVTGIANPRGEFAVVTGAGSIWVPSDEKGEITRVDIATNKIIATIPVNAGGYYLAYGYGSLWVASNKRNTLQRIDPKTNTVVKTTPMGQAPGFLAAGEGGIWVQEQGDGTVARVDPVSGEVTGRVKVSDTLKFGDIATGGGKVWLRTTEGQEFVVIDPKSLAIKARIDKRIGSGALRYSDAGLWTTEHDVKTMTWWPNPAAIGN